jgi:hypothetical protein
MIEKRNNPEQGAQTEKNAQAAQTEREKQRERARTERDKELQRERLELLKLKAGTATAEEIADFAPTEEPKKHYTISQKIGNFIYWYKTYIIIFGALAIIGGFLIVNLLTLVKPDVKIGVITRDETFFANEDKIAAALTPYCSDFNGDGKISVSVLYFSGPVPEDEANPDLSQTAEVIKLSNELQRDEMVLLITDFKMIEEMEIGENVLADGKTLFPGDKNADYYGYKLSGTNFAEAIGYPEMGGDYLAAFRKPKEHFGDYDTFEQNFENAVILWMRFINDEKVN